MTDVDSVAQRGKDVVFSLIRLGRVALLQGKFGRAYEHFAEGLRLSHKYDSRMRLAWCLVGLAELTALNNQPKKAAGLLGSAESMPELTTQLFGHWHFELSEISSALIRISNMLRATLDEDVFKAEYESGKQMSLDEAVTYALKESAQ